MSNHPHATRPRWLLLVLAGLLVVGVGAAVPLISSGASHLPAGGTSQPTAITAPIERRQIVDAIDVEASVSRQFQTPVRIQSVPAVGRPIVTGFSLEPSAQVTEGTVVVEVSGRPVVALQGRLPAYRDLRPGDSGPDVRQLQLALVRLGYPNTDPPGEFESSTARSVERLWRSLGYTVVLTDENYVVQSRHLQDAVAQARRSLKLLRLDLEQAEVAQEQAQMGPNQRDREVGVAGPGGEGASAFDSAAAVARARIYLNGARDGLEAAIAAREEYLEVNGPTVPANEVVFVPRLPAVLAAAAAPLGSDPAESHLTLASGPLRLTAQLPPTTAAQVHPGLAAVFDCGGTRVNAKLRTLREIVKEVESANKPQSRPARAIFQVHRRFSLRGAGSCSGTIVLRKTALGPVVPVSALMTAADGATTVETLDSSDRLTSVAVDVLLAAEGWAAIRAAGGDELAGNRVVVGHVLAAPESLL